MNVRQHQFILTNLDTTEVKEVKISEWENITERLFRSVEYGAVNLSQTLPIRFPRKGGRTSDEGGYYFILDAKESRGVKARIQLEIKKLNSATNAYDDSFVGILDLRPSAGYTKEDEFVEVKVLDSGKFAKFSSRDEIEYNVFDLVSSDDVTVPDFTNPYTEATYKKIDIYLQSLSDGDFVGVRTFTAVGPGVSAGDNWPYEGNNQINEVGDRITIDTPSAGNTIYTNTLDIDTIIDFSRFEYNLDFDIIITYTGVGSYTVNVNFLFQIFDSGGSLVSTRSLFPPIFSGTGSTTQVIPVARTGFAGFLDVTIPAGGRMDFNLTAGVTNAPILTGTTQCTIILNRFSNPAQLLELNLYEQTQGWPDNQIRGLYPYEACSRLIQLMTSELDETKLIQSNILGRPNSEFQIYPGNGLLSRLFITNGYQLRQFINRALNLSFKYLIKSLNAISPIGVWYDKHNDYFVIEDIEEFYLSEYYSFNLGQVPNIKTTDFSELYFNKIKTGYPKQEYEDFQGVNEFNTETEHEISIEEKKTYDVRPEYYGDSIGQELARRKNIDTAASEDTKYDDKIFMTLMNISDETIQGGVSALSGFVGIEQYYNLTITPRQNLKNHIKIIRAPLYKDDSELIKFRKSKIGADISYLDPSSLNNVNEFDDISLSGEPSNIIDPELDEFKSIITNDIADEITANPHKIVRYQDREGNNKYGYIWEVEFNRYKREATFKLIKVNANRLP